MVLVFSVLGLLWSLDSYGRSRRKRRNEAPSSFVGVECVGNSLPELPQQAMRSFMEEEGSLKVPSFLDSPRHSPATGTGRLRVFGKKDMKHASMLGTGHFEGDNEILYRPFCSETRGQKARDHWNRPGIRSANHEAAGNLCCFMAVFRVVSSILCQEPCELCLRHASRVPERQDAVCALRAPQPREDSAGFRVECFTAANGEPLCRREKCHLLTASKSKKLSFQVRLLPGVQTCKATHFG